MNNTASNLFLLLMNFLLWGGSLFYYWKKNHYFGLGTAILLFYTIISAIDFHLFFSPRSIGQFNDLSFFPFIYLYVMMLLVICPILQIRENRITNIYEPTSLFKTTTIILVLLSLYGIWDIVTELPQGLVLLMVDNDYAKEAYEAGLANLDRSRTGGISILNIGCNAARAVAPAFLIYYITCSRINKFILIGLIISSLLGPLEAISKGSRLEPAIFILNLLFLYIFMRKFISNNLKSKIKLFAFSIFLLICIPFLIITISRTEGDTERTFYSFERYAAESFLNFNNYGINANGIRYGDKTFPAFKEICGMETARTYVERRIKYSNMNIDESVFYTFVGDFTLDYGPICTVFIFILTALLFKYALTIRKRMLLFHQYLCLYLLLYGCLGFFQFPLGDINGNMRIILLLFLIFVFKLEYDISKRI